MLPRTPLGRFAVVAVVAAAGAATTGLAIAAGMSLTSSHLGAAAVTTPVMFPVSVSITDKNGNQTGKPANGAIITLVYSTLVDAPTLCSGWVNTKASQAAKLQWSIVDGGTGDDLLVADGSGGACSQGINMGTIDLGSAGYDLSTASILFPGTNTTLTFGTSTTTLTATLGGQKSGQAGTVTAGSPATWTPDPAVTDRAGNNCGANLAESASSIQF